MKIQSTTDINHYDSTIIQGGNVGFGDTFNINPYSGVSYSSDSGTKYTIGCYNYGKYVLNCNIVYTGSIGSIVNNYYVQMIPNDKTSKIEYSQTSVLATSSTINSIYANDNIIAFNYRNTNYYNRQLNLDTGVRTDNSGTYSSGIQLTTTGTNFNGYTPVSSIVVTGSSGSYQYTPKITFTAI